MSGIKKLEAAIRHMYASVKVLRGAFPGKPFTPDGRMVGDIGEAIAALKFGVVLDKKLRKSWDGYRETATGKWDVQVKTTQKDETYLKKPPHEGELLVFKIFEDGSWECCYDGLVQRVWKSLQSKKMDSTKAKFIKLSILKTLQQKA
ncbi:MAG: hypothetical protein Q7S02_04270 [bacterium]|nr:hypothetical protein [bacterium]